ncbi:unnamed protein product, partial [Rotaria sordida]
MIDACGTVSTKLPAIYYGNQGWAMIETEYISSWIGKRPILNNIWNNQTIPVITWELFGCGGVG